MVQILYTHYTGNSSKKYKIAYKFLCGMLCYPANHLNRTRGLRKLAKRMKKVKTEIPCFTTSLKIWKNNLQFHVESSYFKKSRGLQILDHICAKVSYPNLNKRNQIKKNVTKNQEKPFGLSHSIFLVNTWRDLTLVVKVITLFSKYHISRAIHRWR